MFRLFGISLQARDFATICAVGAIMLATMGLGAKVWLAFLLMALLAYVIEKYLEERRERRAGAAVVRA